MGLVVSTLGLKTRDPDSSPCFTNGIYIFFLCRSHDHQFKVFLKPLTKKVILWRSLEDILAKTLTVVLTNIQYHSKDDKQSLLYFCISQDPLVSGIRSSVHALNENSIASMVKTFMSDFHRFLSSNAEMKLNETFTIYFHVASGKDLNRPTHRRKAIPVRSQVGAPPEGNKFKLKGSLVDLPLGAPNNPDCFKLSCGLAAMTFKIMELKEPEVFARAKKLIEAKAYINEKNEAAQHLLDRMETFCLRHSLNKRGPHDLNHLMKLFSQEYSVQIVVIATMTGSKPEFHLWPEDFNFAQPRLYFLLKRNANSPDHLLIINSLNTFFKTYQRAICFFCQKFYSVAYCAAKLARHKCKSSLACQCCFGYYLKPDTLQSNTEPWLFCDKQLLDNSKIKKCCSSCGVTFDTELCFESHNRYCQVFQYYWQCPVCIKSVPMSGTNVEQVAKNHQCSRNDKYCLTCYKVMPLHHVCAISKTEKDNIWPNVAVLSLTFQNALGAQCQVCYERQMTHMAANNLTYRQLLKSDQYYKLLCEKHASKKTSDANVIKIFYETKRFEFVAKTFSDENFLAASEPNFEELNFGYCHNPLPVSSFSSRKRKIKRDDVELFKVGPVQNPSRAKDQFLNFLLSQRLTNTTFLVRSNAEMLYLLELFLSHFYAPSVVQAGRLVKKIQVADFDVTFILFQNYCSGDLKKLLKQFEINRTVHYFPDTFNDAEYLNREIPLPPLSWFFCFNDTTDDKKDKQKYHSSLPSSFNVNQQLFKTISENLKSFLLVVLSFLRMCFELESLIGSITQCRVSNPIHPFGASVMSLSGFSMSLCKFFYLNKEPIHTIMKPYTGFSSQVSSQEHQYVSFLAFCNPEENIVHAFNSPFGQKSFGPYPVDAYGEASLKIYQFHSCELHGHTVPGCTNKRVVSKNVTPLSKNCYGVPVADLLKKSEDIKSYLKSKHGDSVNSYEEMWECTWTEFKKSHPDLMTQFWQQSGLDRLRPLCRLHPRASVRGGFLEVYHLTYEADDQCDLHYFDCNAMYSSIALNADLPLGEYTIFLEAQLKTALKIENNQFFVNGESCEGDIAHVSFLVPKDLAKPFLPYRFNDQVFYSNCYSCLKTKQIGPCIHKTDDKRRFSSVYTVLELEFALTLGYQIYVYELWHFSKTSKLLNEFVSILASYRLKNSGDFFQDMTNDQLAETCQSINSKMNFCKSELLLSPTDIKCNKAAKQFFKDMLNSLYGRFAINTGFSKRIFVRSQHELDNLFANRNVTVLEFFPVADDTIEIEYMPHLSCPPSRDSNLLFTSIINAKGRILMYDIIQKLGQKKCEAIYVDTDGIFFASPKGFKDFPFEVGIAFGQFKPVFPDSAVIKKFYSLGPRNYCVLYEDKGSLQYVTKIKGISATCDNLQNYISPSTYQIFIDQHFKSQVEAVYLPQMRTKIDPVTKTFEHVMISQQFSNELHIKRFILKGQKKHVTYSYGYSFKNVDWK